MKATTSLFSLSVIGLALGLTLAGCQRDGGGGNGGDKKTEQGPPKVGPGTPGGSEGGSGESAGEGGSADGDELERLPVASSMTLSLGLVDAGTSVSDTPTYPDVAPILNQHCAGCHKAGFASPLLDTFPFTAVNGDSLATIIEKLALRINDTARPMPPQGLMDPALRAQLGAWIDAGYPAAPTTRSGLSFTGYKVEWRYRLSAGASAENWSAWQQAAASESIALGLGTHEPGVALDVELKVVGPRGGELARKSLVNVVVSSNGQSSASMVAAAEDQGAPVPGNQGKLAITSAVGGLGYMVTWNGAADDITPAENLEYQVYVATGNVIRTVEDMLANGTTVGDFNCRQP